MNKNLIKNYISKIDKKDIIDFANKEKVFISDYEINLILDLIKKDTDIILSDQFLNYLENYKNEFSEEIYNLIIEKYNKYKSFIL